MFFFFFFGGGGGLVGSAGGRVRGQGRCEQRSEIFVKNSKNKLGGGEGVRSGGGRSQVDVNKKLKFL